MSDLTPDPTQRRPRRTVGWIVGGIAALLTALVVGPWVYVTFLNDDQPEKLSLDSAPSAAASSTTPSAGVTSAAATASASAAPGDTPASLDGEWAVGPGSVVGYRVKEVLFGQSTEGVGRTNDVTGDLSVAADSVTKAEFVADLTTVKSDKSQRDGQFRGRIMDTDTHPKATFTLTAPIAVPADARSGSEFGGKATGELTLRGKTKTVSFDIAGKASGAGFDVTAQIPIIFADFEIPDPSGGPAKVGDEGVLEVLLKLAAKP